MPRPFEHVNFPKIVTVLAVTFGVALGACGLTFLAGNRSGGSSVLPLGIIELAVMVLSAVALVITVVFWIVAAAIGGRTQGGPENFKLIDDSDKRDHERKGP